MAIDNKFKFQDNSSSGHIMLTLIFLSEGSCNDTLDGDEIEEKGEAEINLNYHVDLSNGIHYKDTDNQAIWAYVYPQLKVDVALYCNSICLPGFVLPYELKSGTKDGRD